MSALRCAWKNRKRSVRCRIRATSSSTHRCGKTGACWLPGPTKSFSGCRECAPRSSSAPAAAQIVQANTQALEMNGERSTPGTVVRRSKRQPVGPSRDGPAGWPTWATAMPSGSSAARDKSTRLNTARFVVAYGAEMASSSIGLTCTKCGARLREMRITYTAPSRLNLPPPNRRLEPRTQLRAGHRLPPAV